MKNILKYKFFLLIILILKILSVPIFAEKNTENPKINHETETSINQISSEKTSIDKSKISIQDNKNEKQKIIEEICYEILNEYVTKDLGSQVLEGRPSNYSEFQSKADTYTDKYEHLLDVFFENTDFKNYSVNYGEQGNFSFMNGYSFYNLDKDLFRDERPFSKHSISYTYITPNNNNGFTDPQFMYCRHRFIDTLNGPKSLKDISSEDIGTVIHERKATVEDINKNGYKFRKVYIEWPTFDSKSNKKTLFMRKEFYVVPDIPNSFYEPYEVFKTHVQAVNDYLSWEKEAMKEISLNSKVIYEKDNDIIKRTTKKMMLGYYFMTINDIPSRDIQTAFQRLRDLLFMMKMNYKIAYELLIVSWTLDPNERSNDRQRENDTLYKNQEKWYDYILKNDPNFNEQRLSDMKTFTKYPAYLKYDFQDTNTKFNGKDYAFQAKIDAEHFKRPELYENIKIATKLRELQKEENLQKESIQFGLSDSDKISAQSIQKKLNKYIENREFQTIVDSNISDVIDGGKESKGNNSFIIIVAGSFLILFIVILKRKKCKKKN